MRFAIYMICDLLAQGADLMSKTVNQK